eukprot:763280-Hanusia_phi.AAC.2
MSWRPLAVHSLPQVPQVDVRGSATRQSVLQHPNTLLELSWKVILVGMLLLQLRQVLQLLLDVRRGIMRPLHKSPETKFEKTDKEKARRRIVNCLDHL